MDDIEILDLFFARKEQAIAETQEKYGRYCYSISYHILYNDADANECVNDVLNRAWDAIPPHRPDSLKAFLGKISRSLSLDQYKNAHAAKRGYGATAAALDELQQCIPDLKCAADPVDDIILRDALNAFLRALPVETRKIFMRRYWYMASIKEIAHAYQISESKVKMTLLRTRKKLKIFLEKEGIAI